MNELLFVLTVLLCLTGVLVVYKLFGKNGLYIFTVFATLLGNIAVCKCMTLWGFSATGGNILYASTFLITDILSEKYGKKEAKNAVKYSFAAMIMWIIGTQIILLFAPSGDDMVNDSLKQLFSFVPRITLASICGFFCSQNIDLFLYHMFWKKTGAGSKFLWLRNNCSTLISQLVDTAIFTTIAFAGSYEKSTFLSIMFTTYFFKALVAIMDTPFIYIACKIKPIEEKKCEEQ